MRYIEADAVTAYVDDVPASPVLLPIQPTEGLAWVTGADGTFTDALGETHTLTVSFVPEAGAVGPHFTVTFPSGAFAAAGLGYLVINLTGADDLREGVDHHPVVTEARGRWLTCEETRRLWLDAPEDTLDLWLLLDSAHSACVEYAPEIETDLPLIPAYKRAQLVQARNSWEAVKSGGTESLGSEGFAVIRHPLDWHVKQLLRPESIPPVVT